MGEVQAAFLERGAEEEEEAERLRELRALRRKRTKPQDWINMTFHQYRLMNVIGAGTFGEVRDSFLPLCFFVIGRLGSVVPPQPRFDMLLEWGTIVPQPPPK